MASPLTATLTMFSIQVGFPVAGILVADKMFKRTKRTRKFRYGLAITSFAFGGWYLSNYFTEMYLENVDITLSAENDSEDWEEVWDDNLMDWFSKHLIFTEPYEAKNSSSRVISFDYRLLDNDGKHLSTYPEERLKPIVYEPMDDMAGLEEIEYEVYDLWNQADGYYFISRNVPNTNQSERSELIFFTMSGDGRKRPLHIFQLARTTMY